ncbi:lytic polysaccharide monooxygenase [Haloglycomyces albus]|uniref:lytic polysaccharide monooxygenase n=1 Tax=Haloglycomyces albus TaxID=526067 RepID=UPI00046CA6E6|nr:lytic polysaccharide monooxygenase [Haloglycomyces albus]
MGFKKMLAGGAVGAGAVAASFAIASPALGHGWVTDDVGDLTSRSGFCAEGVATDCGSIEYEPQSVEGPKGFPEAGPEDGSICGVGAYPELDDPRGGNWPKNEVSAGSVDIGWNFTANHSTTKWEYYITQDNWDPTEPITRAQLESEPFAVVDWDGSQPPKQYIDTVDLPAKDGHHVILAVWEIDDTANSFYNCIDVDYNGNNGGDDGDDGSDGGDDGGDQPGTCEGVSDWSEGATYTSGDEVAHDGRLYSAQWWTRGDEPGTTGEWGVWTDEGAC